jgi:hypothetical protein
MMEREMLEISSKSSPAARRLFTFDVLFSDLYWAAYFIIAEFTPQSLNSVTRFGEVNATMTKPYSDGDRSLATVMTPNADMTVEAAKPQKRLKPPLAETLAILVTFTVKTPPLHVSHK